MKKTFLLLFILFFSISKTHACRCIRSDKSLNKKVKKAFKQADLILSGKVIAMNVVNEKDLRFSSDLIRYTFEIKKTIKGKIKREIIEISSSASSASCGYLFELGRSYLVYAKKWPQVSSKTKNTANYFTSLCDRNQQLKNVHRKELIKLKKLSRRKIKQLNDN